jgi:hypothetical protein
MSDKCKSRSEELKCEFGEEPYVIESQGLKCCIRGFDVTALTAAEQYGQTLNKVKALTDQEFDEFVDNSPESEKEILRSMYCTVYYFS